MTKSFTSSAISKISGEFAPPGDKSISHRAIMLSSMATGVSQFTNFLEADDCLRTMEAFREMGVLIERRKNGALAVHGVGLKGFQEPKKELSLGNSGTTMRLLLGILAHQPFEVKLTGDDSLVKRPMRRVTVPLRKMGAKITGDADANFAPLTIRGGSLVGIHHVNDPASAQVKSAILLAGLAARGTTIVQEAILSRDHTERMLQMIGAPIERKAHVVQVSTAKRLNAIQYDIPGDISSAAFMIVAAAILPGSDLTVQNVGLNPTRIGILEVLHSMGARISWKVKSSQDGEPAGEIHVRGSELKSITIKKQMIPKLIDELPVLMIACAAAEGKSVISGARELRAKETDRIKSMVQGLNAIGGHAEEREDGCVINGLGKNHFTGGNISSFGDHRTAMSFIVAGLKSNDPVVVEDIDCIDTSYPSFFKDLKKLSV